MIWPIENSFFGEYLFIVTFWTNQRIYFPRRRLQKLFKTIFWADFRVTVKIFLRPCNRLICNVTMCNFEIEVQQQIGTTGKVSNFSKSLHPTLQESWILTLGPVSSDPQSRIPAKLSLKSHLKHLLNLCWLLYSKY